jgi:hypothetical protein
VLAFLHPIAFAIVHAVIKRGIDEPPADALPVTPARAVAA